VSVLTDVQRAALTAWWNNRIVVVRACPGSGKTRVFVEALREELERVDTPRRGVAALSFTNVAQDEIATRIGGSLVAPNYVDTLDAFLWRFVVVPFGHLVGVRRTGAVLVPAPLESTLRRPEVQYGLPNERAPLYRCRLRCGAAGSMRVEIEPFGGRRFDATAEQATRILRAKQASWASTGHLTHSDSHFVAAQIMASTSAQFVGRIIAARFRALLVDECQDTRGYMANALVRILECSGTRAFVVGDPDQSIYGFGGGDRTVMNRIEACAGAIVRDLDETHRCSLRVARVVSGLSRRDANVVPRADASEGNAMLVIHSHDQPQVDDLLSALAARGTPLSQPNGVVLVRKRATKQRLKGMGTECPLSSTLGVRLARAADALEGGDPTGAFTIASHGLADLILDGSPDAEALVAAGLDRSRWRRAVYRVLQEAARETKDDTWRAWRERMKATCVSVGLALGKPIDPRRSSGAFRAGEGEDVRRGVRDGEGGATANRPNVETIHGVKGQEFDAVLIYVPKPHATQAPCPSQEWWSTDPDSEEREVAFVAVSRAKTTVAIAIHQRTAENLRRDRPDFVALFEEVSVVVPATAPRPGGRKKPS
jgi:DNA helicase-2/ATP-dependent DNA helicase PcrA